FHLKAHQLDFVGRLGSVNGPLRDQGYFFWIGAGLAQYAHYLAGLVTTGRYHLEPRIVVDQLGIGRQTHGERRERPAKAAHLEHGFGTDAAAIDAAQQETVDVQIARRFHQPLALGTPRKRTKAVQAGQLELRGTLDVDFFDQLSAKYGAGRLLARHGQRQLGLRAFGCGKLEAGFAFFASQANQGRKRAAILARRARNPPVETTAAVVESQKLIAAAGEL